MKQRTLIGLLFVAALLGTTGFVLGLVPAVWAGPTYLGLAALILLIAAVGSRREGHWSLAAVSLVALVAASVWALYLADVRAPDIAELGPLLSLPELPASFLPDWWPLVIVLPAALAVLQGLLREPHDGWTSEPADTLWTLPGRPLVFGAAMLVGGTLGTLFAGLTLFQKVAIVAPVFEELAKLGAALLFLRAMRLDDPLSVYAVGALAGLGFGVLEHTVTYPGESDLLYLSRVCFHLTATALSTTILAALVRTRPEEIEVRWMSTVPSTIVHAANNILAIVIGLAGVVVPAGGRFVPPIGFFFGAGMLAVAVVTNLKPEVALEPLTRLLVAVRGSDQEPDTEIQGGEPVG